MAIKVNTGRPKSLPENFANCSSTVDSRYIKFTQQLPIQSIANLENIIALCFICLFINFHNISWVTEKPSDFGDNRNCVTLGLRIGRVFALLSDLICDQQCG